jgi:DNA-directed RNA polymerase specialized sigma24 family protein
MTAEEDDSEYLSQAKVAAAIDAMPNAEFKRLMKQSRFMSLTVPGMSDCDLLHEALVRLRDGQRQWKRGVDLGATVYMIMASIARDARKQAKNAPIDRFAVVTEGDGHDEDDDEAPQKTETAVAVGTPEEIAGVRELFRVIEHLAAKDADEEAVLIGWADGLSAEEAAANAGIDMKDYDNARKRLERKVAKVKKQAGQ